MLITKAPNVPVVSNHEDIVNVNTSPMLKDQYASDRAQIRLLPLYSDDHFNPQDPLGLVQNEDSVYYPSNYGNAINYRLYPQENIGETSFSGPETRPVADQYQIPTYESHFADMDHMASKNSNMLIFNVLDNKKKRRRLSSEETRTLLDVFERDQRPNSSVRNQLAMKLSMTPRAIQIWFQNRRAKFKRDMQEASLMPASIYFYTPTSQISPKDTQLSCTISSPSSNALLAASQCQNQTVPPYPQNVDMFADHRIDYNFNRDYVWKSTQENHFNNDGRSL